MSTTTEPDMGQTPPILPDKVEKKCEEEFSQYIPYPQFMLFGDSLIQFSNQYKDGFCFTSAVELLGFDRRLDLVNRGMSGYNTDQALKLVKRIIDKPENGRIKYLLILFGANDACLRSSSSGQHVPLERYKENLKNIINHPLIAAHGPKIILVCPPPCDANRCLVVDFLKGVTEVRREASQTATYSNAAKMVGEAELGERGVVVDLWTAFMKYAAANTPNIQDGEFIDQDGELLGSRSSAGQCKALVELMHDGLHMTGKGYNLFFDEVVKAIQQKWPDDIPESMPMVHPPWGEAFK